MIFLPAAIFHHKENINCIIGYKYETSSRSGLLQPVLDTSVLCCDDLLSIVSPSLILYICQSHRPCHDHVVSVISTHRRDVDDLFHTHEGHIKDRLPHVIIKYDIIMERLLKKNKTQGFRVELQVSGGLEEVTGKGQEATQETRQKTQDTRHKH